jgi:hypothetical protein
MQKLFALLLALGLALSGVTGCGGGGDDTEGAEEAGGAADTTQ